MRPLPSFPIVRDLVVDMTRFWKQYGSIRPYLIHAYRFISDSRDRATTERLHDLNHDPYRLFRCRTIMNGTEVCPVGRSPSRAIERIRLRMSKIEGHSGGLALHRVPTIR